MLLRRLRLFAAASASALLISRGQADASPAPLRTLHEALATGPLAIRFSAAEALGGSLWSLGYITQDLRSNTRAPQAHVVDIDAQSPIVAAKAVDGATKITRSPEHSIEFRQMSCDGGKKLAVEMWSSSGVRLARRVVDGVGPAVLPGGVFGKPQFSPSGSAVVWAAERKPSGADAPGYWPAASTPAAAGGIASGSSGGGSGGGGNTDGDTDASAEASAAGAVIASKYSLDASRGTGEMLLVHSAQLVVWDWRRDAMRTIEPESVLPEGSLDAGHVALAVQPTFDGSDGGLIFAAHLLPPWRPGISACLNRPTRLYHLRQIWEESGPAPTGAAPSTAAAAAAATPAECLTPSLYFAHMPRVSPDGATLAFAARPHRFKGHSTCYELRTMPWPPPRAAAAGADAAGLASSVLLPSSMSPAPNGFAGWCGSP